ncbi:MAG TPA: hypothetical protein DHN33_06475 [Eubacteriaceae bacterium]|nr:hypothetical protein [Eubacteriaceae bacterium]
MENTLKWIEKCKNEVEKEWDRLRGQEKEYCGSNKLEEKEQDVFKKEVLKEIDGLDKGMEISENSESEDYLLRAGNELRNQGKMPYYLSKAIAYRFYVEKNTNREMDQDIQKSGIKEAVQKHTDLNDQREWIQRIADHYMIWLDDGKDVYSQEQIELIKKAYEKGFHYELTIKGCAQCTLAAMFDVTGNRYDILFQSAGGLAGGMALSGDGSCGAYTGGIMMMGTYAGRRLERIPVDGDKEAKVTSYKMSQALHDKFIETYGGVVCGEIHREIFGRAYCIRDKEDNVAFEKAGAHTTKCTTVVGNASAWVTELLIDFGYIK